MSAGDFVEVYSKQTGTFHCVMTQFFIDTAKNVIEYMEIIYNLLKPGGVWINFGPLLWFYAEQEDQLQLEISLEEVLKLIPQVGFKLQTVERHDGLFCHSPDTMIETLYRCCFFVAVKPLE